MSKPDPQEYLNFIADWYLGVRPRSEAEVISYLTRKMSKFKLPPEEIGQMVQERIAYYKEIDVINDATFAQWYVDEKTQFKSRGSIRIRIELRQKGVDQEIIDAALGRKETPDDDLIQKLLETRYRSKDLNDFGTRQKVMQGLVRRGFSYDAIKKSIEEYEEKE